MVFKKDDLVVHATLKKGRVGKVWWVAEEWISVKWYTPSGKMFATGRPKHYRPAELKLQTEVESLIDLYYGI